MSSVLQLQKTLVAPPVAPTVEAVRLRHYAGEADIAAWLLLRQQAFARERLGIGQWGASDFRREFLHKPWWRPQRMWLAVAEAAAEPLPCIGTITLAMRGPEEDSQPAVHWLAVAPRWRRRGVGRLLLATLEAACWSAGQHTIVLETHAAWQSAARFYAGQGYA